MNTRIKIDGWQIEQDANGIAVSIGEHSLGRAVLAVAQERLSFGDDAGCDWGTDNHGNTYVMFDTPVRVSCDRSIAALIDAANALRGIGLIKVGVFAPATQEHQP